MNYAEGGIKSYTQDSGQVKYYTRNKSADLYLQDDWRILPHLTINVGLRASLFGAWYNPKGTAYNWRPEAFSQSIGSSIYIDNNSGNLVYTNSGSPVPLNRSGGPYSLDSTSSTAGFSHHQRAGAMRRQRSVQLLHDQQPLPSLAPRGLFLGSIRRWQDRHSRRLRPFLGTRNRL